MWFAVGLRRQKNDITLDVLYPKIEAITDTNKKEIADIKTLDNGYQIISKDIAESLLKSDTATATNTYAHCDFILFTLTDSSQAVENAEEAYFKLQLISQRHVKPHDITLDGMFGKIENIAWSNKGPLLTNDTEAERIKHQFSNEPLSITHIDKFPYLVNYHIPSGIRIADGSRVRLGAYLGEGTTVMPAGYINFNAGTEGNAMVEGRISAGVVVGKDSDVGGGASIMGTLSGGNDHVISVGAKCLLGANAGTGISLGFGCTIQAGVYITAGMKIYLYNEKNTPTDINGNEVKEGENLVKGSDLSGKDTLLFMQDSRNGKVICKPNPKTIALNNELHAHN